MLRKITDEMKFQFSYFVEKFILGMLLFWDYVKVLFKAVVSRVLCKLGLCPQKDYDKLLEDYFELAVEQEKLKRKLEELSI